MKEKIGFGKLTSLTALSVITLMSVASLARADDSNERKIPLDEKIENVSTCQKVLTVANIGSPFYGHGTLTVVKSKRYMDFLVDSDGQMVPGSMTIESARVPEEVQTEDDVWDDHVDHLCEIYRESYLSLQKAQVEDTHIALGLDDKGTLKRDFLDEKPVDVGSACGKVLTIANIGSAFQGYGTLYLVSRKRERVYRVDGAGNVVPGSIQIVTTSGVKMLRTDQVIWDDTTLDQACSSVRSQYQNN